MTHTRLRPARGRRGSLLLPIVYAISLLLPQGAGLELRGGAECDWHDPACADSLLALHSHAVAPALSGETLRVLTLSGRASGPASEQLRLGGDQVLYASRQHGDGVRAAASRRGLPAIPSSSRLEVSGLLSSPPRAPPVLL